MAFDGPIERERERERERGATRAPPASAPASTGTNRSAGERRRRATRRRSVLDDLKAQADAGDRMAALRHKRLQEYFARHR
jgi:hypothetical protein